MTLIQQIDADYITAVKAREMEKVNALRLMKSAIKNEAIKLHLPDNELDDNGVLAVLNREMKQRRDAIAQYTAANRNDLVVKEQNELTIIESYMPKGMDDVALQALVDDIITETGATQKSDMGKVMGVLRSRITNPGDVSKAATLINQKLQ